jgi:hypothetical protein
VDADLLNAEQVLASSNAAGDGDIVGGCAILVIRPVSVSIDELTLKVPRSLVAGEGGANLLDLDPVGRAVSAGSAGDLAQVERDRALVVDSLVSGEGDLGASSDRDSGSLCSASATNVAAQVVRREVGDGRVVVGVLADVLVNITLDTVGGQALEDVWRCQFE